MLNRPEDDPARPHTVAPGAYAFRAPDPEPRARDREPRVANREPRIPDPGSRIPTEYSVVWWDPHILHLGAASSFGLRRDDLIVKDGDMFAVEERMAEYERWRLDRQVAIAGAERPSVRVQTATAWAASAAQLGIDEEIAAAGTIQIVELPGAAGRPRGPRFGTLVHAVLATVALDASDQDVRRTAETQGRMLLSTIEEIRAAGAVASAVIGHDTDDRLGARAR